MQINKFMAGVSAIIFIALGFVVAYFMLSTTTDNISVKQMTDIEYVKQMNKEDLQKIEITLDSANALREPNVDDSLQTLKMVRDSLLVSAGAIRANLVNPAIAQDVKIKLDDLLRQVKALGTKCDEIIMHRALSLLSPINKELRALVKEMKDKTDELEATAGTIESISQVVASVVNILSTPLLVGLLTPTPVPSSPDI